MKPSNESKGSYIPPNGVLPPPPTPSLSPDLKRMLDLKRVFIKDFAKKILHGDEEHRKWLIEAADAYIEDKPMPPSRHNTGIDNEVPTQG